MRTPLSGLLYSILFCAFSLLVAELLTTLLVELQFIDLEDSELTHTLLMLTALVAYFHFAPSSSDNASDPDESDDPQDPYDE